MNGRTDREIALELFVLNGVEHPERHLDAFCGALAEALAGKAELIRARGRAYPGARRTLERLAAEPGVVQSVLTGNIEPNAELKLASFSLHEHLDLDVGGYGSDHSVRAELVSAARRKAESKHGLRFAPSETVVIGDTPLDVAAARAAGARPFGVASGPFGIEELSEAGAEAVFEDLRDSELVVRAIAADGR
jgi:phosphoglycolate phosphatase